MSRPVLSNLDFNNVARGINHPDPVSAQDLATKNYVDSPRGNGITLAPTGALGVVDISTLKDGGAVLLNPTGNFNIDGFTAKTDGFTFDLIYQLSAAFAGTLNENVGNTSTSIRNPGGLALQFWTAMTVSMRYQAGKWRTNSPTLAPTMPAQSVLVNAAGSTAPPSALQSTTNDTLLRRNTAGVVDFGRIRPGMFDALSQVPLSGLADQAAGTVMGRPVGAGTGTPSAMTGAQLFEAIRLGTVQDYAAPDGTTDSVALNATTTVLRVSSADGAEPSLAGFSGGSAGRPLLVVNNDAINDAGITYLNEAGLLNTADQLTTPGRQDYLTRYGDAFLAVYDGGRSKWQFLGKKLGLSDLYAMSPYAIVCNPGIGAAVPQEMIVGTNSVVGRQSGVLMHGPLIAAQMTDAILLPAKLAVVTSGLGVPFVLPVTLTAGTPGTPDDVTVYAGNAPFKFEVMRVDPRITTAIASSTLKGWSSTGGLGTGLTDTFSTAATGPAAVTAGLAAITTIAANGSFYLRRSDRGVAGKVYIHAVRVP